ncbi:MAG: hypothetical protein M5U08_13805 [Burkholderiales bacterium]|nr:hypothetical protein [Burkholderiales bacterium]
MRVNVYAEEMPAEPRLEIIEKEIEGQIFTALRIYLELPATVDGQQYQGPFMHRPGDDDSAAVTFWGQARPARDAPGGARAARRALREARGPPMKAHITSTDRIVTIDPAGNAEARVREGVTEGGVRFTAYITTCQVRRDADNSEFERELREHKPPDADTLRAIDMRFIV